MRGGQLRVTQSILILVFLDFNILDFVTSIILTNASSLHFLVFLKAITTTKYKIASRHTTLTPDWVPQHGQGFIDPEPSALALEPME